MAIPTALLAKVLGGIGAVAAVVGVGSIAFSNKSKDGDTKEQSTGKSKPKAEKPQLPSPEETLKALNDKIKSLGIEGCELENGQSKTKECSLDAAKIKVIKFEGKSGDTVTDNASLTLKIEKGYEGLDFPEGLRFSFTNSSGNDITIGNSGSEIKLLQNTTYDYKIKTEGENKTLEKAWNLSGLLNKVGLTCGSDTPGECSFSSGINVWKNEGNNKFKLSPASSMPPPPSTSDTQTKIKVTRDNAGYRQGIKFYVEEEITLKTDSILYPQDYPLNKETSYEIDIKEATIYSGEIQRKEKKWFLVDKSTTKLNEKIKALGITDCVLEEVKTKKENCTLNAEKIKAINFDGKEGEASSPDNNASLTLNIERDHLGSEFPWGLRFTFTNSSESDVTIGSSSPITFKAGFTYDYKMKTDGTKLEKAWTITTLAAKVGLTCTNDTDSECTLKTTGINAWRDESHYITNAQISDSSKKMTVEKDQKGYLEGFKFTVKDEGDITLSGGTKKTGNDGIDKLTKTNMNYGIDVKDIGGIKTWFLVEKSTTLPA